MQTFDQALAANQQWPCGVPGTYFRLMAAVSPVSVELLRNGIAIYRAENVIAGLWSRPKGGFEAVRVTNGATAQSVQIAVVDGDGGYDMVGIAGTLDTRAVLANTITDAAAVVVGLAATLIAAADSARKCLRVFNDGAVSVYLGSAGVTVAAGAVKIAPGELWIETDAPGAAWYGIAGTAAQSVRVQSLTVAP